jgi:hypothetical protein
MHKKPSGVWIMPYTTIDNPELYFQTKVYIADQQDNRAITFDGSENMQPDFIWNKNLDQAVTHMIFDSVRGVTKDLAPDQTSAEATSTDHLKSFDTNGFTVSTSWGNYATGNEYVSWCWKAGGSASSNSNGSITTSVSANTTAGFSIVSWTGNGTDGASIGHGLVNPNLCIIKRRDASGHSWFTGGYPNTSLFANDGDHLNLDSTGALSNSSTKEIDLSTNSGTTCTFVDSGNDININGGTFIGYFFKNIKGYSKVGSYTGNGSSDGTFIYTGFRPAFVLQKKTSGTSDWVIYDNKRDPSNVVTKEQKIDNITEGNFTNIDILSNGFKQRSNYAYTNNSGGTYIYMAFAESPFVNSNGVPTNAR